MRKSYCFIFLLCFVNLVWAQKVDYNKGIIAVNGTNVGKVEVLKENFGPTKNFNIYSLQGEKLISAVLTTEFETNKSDNSSLYYRFSFLPTNQTGIFKIATLGPEKSIVNLVGKSGIIENNNLNQDKVNQFIAEKGQSPKVAYDYTVVSRIRTWPVELDESKRIMQGSIQIGFFVAKGRIKDQDYYDFFLPSGVLIAKINFTGGNNAQNMELFTAKDKYKRMVSIATKDKIIAASESDIDPNYLALRRIAIWLVDKDYM